MGLNRFSRPVNPFVHFLFQTHKTPPSTRSACNCRTSGDGGYKNSPATKARHLFLKCTYPSGIPLGARVHDSQNRQVSWLTVLQASCTFPVSQWHTQALSPNTVARPHRLQAKQPVRTSLFSFGFFNASEGTCLVASFFSCLETPFL